MPLTTQELPQVASAAPPEKNRPLDRGTVLQIRSITFSCYWYHRPEYQEKIYIHYIYYHLSFLPNEIETFPHAFQNEDTYFMQLSFPGTQGSQFFIIFPLIICHYLGFPRAHTPCIALGNLFKRYIFSSFKGSTLHLNLLYSQDLRKTLMQLLNYAKIFC